LVQRKLEKMLKGVSVLQIQHPRSNLDYLSPTLQVRFFGFLGRLLNVGFSSLEAMTLSSAFVAMLRNRRFWVWQLFGAFIYAIPVLIRYGTGDVVIPILNFPGYWIGHIIPGNMLEKVLVNAFFPGGAGAVAGEIFAVNLVGGAVFGRRKYLYRLSGAFAQTALWSTFQFLGYMLMISGPSGASGSNLFESVYVFPINFVLAALSIFTPDVVKLIARCIKRIHVGSTT
jgi:hypothetical protein